MPSGNRVSDHERGAPLHDFATALGAEKAGRAEIDPQDVHPSIAEHEIPRLVAVSGEVRVDDARIVYAEAGAGEAMRRYTK